MKEALVILRKVSAAIAVSALVLSSIAVGSTAAFAAPTPPTVDELFFPNPWFTDGNQPQVQGNMSFGTEDVWVESSQDGVTFVPYCHIDVSPSQTVWFCTTPSTTLPLGVNHIRAIGSDEFADASPPGPPITITVVNAPTITSPADGLYTNDNTPTFVGGSEGSNFDVTSTDFATDFCNGSVVNQTWNCTPISPVPDGDHTYFVSTRFVGSTTDIFSNSRTLHIDTVLTPLNTTIDGPSPLVTTDETPTVTGTAEPFATITMWKDYLTEIFCSGGSPVADAGGAWSCTFAAPLTATGIYTISSQQTDRAGNTNIGMSPDPQLQLNYTDVTPPAPPIVTSPIGTIALGMNVVITNSTTATVTGTGEPGATLNMFGNNCIIWPTTVDSGGNWTCQLVTPMTPDGDFDVFFGQQDAAFNSSTLASPGLRFTVDTVAPSAPTVTSPTGPSFGGVFHVTTANRQPLITGSAEDGAAVRIYRGGSIPVPCLESPLIAGSSGFVCHVSSPLPYGTSNYSFAQTDIAGNPSGPAVTRLQLTIPSPPPPAPAVTPMLGFSWLLHFSTTANDAKPGQKVTLTGSDLPPGSAVSAELHSTPVPLGTTVVKDDGTFVLNAIIPLTVEPGPHHYVVTVVPLDGPPQTAEIPVTVLFVPAPVAASPIPTVTTPAENNASGRGESPPIPRNAPAAPNSLSHALPTVFDVIANPLVVAAAAASSLALLFLVAFPAELLNSTLDANYARIFGKFPKMRFPWFARLRDRLKRAPALGGLALTTLAALIFSFADPQFGFDLASLRLFLACAIGMVVLGFVANEITRVIIRRRWSIMSVIKLQPFGLLVAIVGVILSRVLDFAPGLLIGLVLGLSLSAGVSAKDEVRAVLVWAGVILGLAVASWLVYSFGSRGGETGTFASALFDDSVVAVATEGISGLVIGLLPLGFLDGRSVFHHSRQLWLGVYSTVLISFFVIVVPSGALWGDIDGTFWIWLTVLLVFAALCVSVYLWFQTHPEREEAGGDHGEPPDEITVQVNATSPPR